MLRLERVGHVLEEDQPEHHVLVLGRFHVAARRIHRLLELGLVAEGSGSGTTLRRLLDFGCLGGHHIGGLGKSLLRGLLQDPRRWFLAFAHWHPQHLTPCEVPVRRSNGRIKPHLYRWRREATRC